MNSKIETEKIVKFIRKYFKENKLGGVVIGISGGKDSAVTAALFAKALKKENILGVTMPCHSKQTDKKDANLIKEKYGFEMIDIDLTNTFNTYKKEIEKLGNYTNKQLENSDINLKPRLRMSTLYYLAALYTKIKGKTYIVAGTGNKCEIYVGYFTKGGDGMSDINILSNYTVSEVIKIGEYLHVPKEVLYKKPSDGLGKLTDEEKLGVTYREIEDYLKGNQISKEAEATIKKLHRDNLHKESIVTLDR